MHPTNEPFCPRQSRIKPIVSEIGGILMIMFFACAIWYFVSGAIDWLFTSGIIAVNGRPGA